MRRLVLALALAIFLGPWALWTVAAQPTGGEIESLRRLTTQIEALIEGTLDPAIEPETLFTVDLQDERAITIEVRRLRAVVASSKPAPLPVPVASVAGGGGAGSTEVPPDGSAPAPSAPVPSRPAPSASPSASAVPPPPPPPPPPEDPRWLAQLALDEARLDFLERPRAERQAILDGHAERRRAASEEAKRQRDAELRQQTAEQEREEALEAARRARTEALRRVENERARLLSVRVDNTSLEQALQARKAAVRERPNEVVEWVGKVERLIEARESGDAGYDAADALYDALVAELKKSRERLAGAVGRSRDDTAITPVGDGSLGDLGVEVDVAEVATLRADVAAEATRIRTLEREVREAETEQLVDEVRRLNRLRLALLPHLSEGKRDPLYGFGAKGRAQARVELSQVATILRYHVNATTRWVRDLRGADDDQLTATAYAVQILVVLLIYAWWLRRADRTLEDLYHREVALARQRRAPRRAFPEAVRFLQRIRRPLEGVVVFQVVLALLPHRATNLEEVQLVSITLWWTLGEALVVDTIHALWSRQRRLRKGDREAAELRLKALRFVGRVVVLFGLSLSLTSRLVGAGTIYNWVVTLAQWATLPVAAVVLHWYRPAIFARLERLPRKPWPVSWAAEHPTGVLSFAAAGIATVFLTGRWLYRFARTYLANFDWTRRILAYWFRRELTRQEDEKKAREEALEPLGPETWEGLDPAVPPVEIVASEADPQLEEVIRCIEAPGGGVFAVVGERGRGKSTLLRRIETRCRTTLIHCPPTLQELLHELREAFDVHEDADLEALGEVIDAEDDDTALVIDDVHHLVRPVIGGLDDFEALLAVARESSVRSCTWVFAMDGPIWQFVERARGSKPLFDDVIEMAPWSEDNLALLLKQRSAAIGLEPRFDRLLRETTTELDPVDQTEALQRAETNYYRLLWDYSGGNPGVALHFWRDSLRVDEEGEVWVRLFTPPNTTDIESLPDEAVFVLRAVVQLELATVEGIIAATMLPATQVRDTLRYALTRGYVELEGKTYRVRWTWFRAITTILQRRHLLVARS